MKPPSFLPSSIFGIATVVVLSFGSMALAHPPGPPPDGPPMMEHHFERRLEKLGLSAEQNDKIHAILDAAKAQREEKRTAMEAAMDQMHALLEQDTPDEAAIMQQADKLGSMRTEAHKTMLHTLLQVRAELTPEQRAKLKAMRPEGPPPWRHHGPPPPED